MRGHVVMVTRGHGERQGSRGDRKPDRMLRLYFQVSANLPVSLLSAYCPPPATRGCHPPPESGLSYPLTATTYLLNSGNNSGVAPGLVQTKAATSTAR
jgi:hypothetical protein